MPCGLKSPSAPELHICSRFPSPLDFYRLPSSNNFAICSSITSEQTNFKKTPGALLNDFQPITPFAANLHRRSARLLSQSSVATPFAP
ncbi:hypothetical protein VTH06DRAFT_8404 [Thermothelomyces fergusii]